MARPPASAVAKARRAARLRRMLILIVIMIGLLLLCSTVSAIAKRGAHASASNQVDDPTASVSASVSAGRVKILLLGSDQRPNDPGYRTDVIILLMIDPYKMTVSAVSFPRDLWVKVPGMGEMKINQVQQLGGFKATSGMFQSTFGVTPDYYVQTNFGGFIQFIDILGGVDVEVGQELTDSCDLPQAVDGDCTVQPGAVHMNGATALWYVRSRTTSSDFDRLRRAQEVLMAAFKKMINFNTVTKLSEIKAQLNDNIQTNLSIEKAISFLPVALSVLKSPDHIKRLVINEDQTTPSWSWNGMWILLPDKAAIDDVLKQAGMK